MDNGSMKPPKPQHQNYKSTCAGEGAFIPAGMRVDNQPGGTANHWAKEIRNLWYTTATQDSYRGGMRGSDKINPIGQNCLVMHGPNAGVEPGTYKPSRAPLANRNSTQMARDFEPLPLDGKVLNAEAAAYFKFKSLNTNIDKSQAAQNNQSVSATDFVPFSSAKMKNAIPRNFKPKQETHIRADQKFHTDGSMEHSAYGNLDQKILSIARGINCKEAIQTHLVHAPFEGSSTTQNQFQFRTMGKKKKPDSSWQPTIYHKGSRDQTKPTRVGNADELWAKVASGDLVMDDMRDAMNENQG